MSRRKAEQYLSLSLDYSEFRRHENEAGERRAPEDVMLARLRSYVVKGRLWHTAGYLSAPKTRRDSQVGREKWSSSFGLYLTHLPSSFDIEEDVVTNVPGAGDAP